MSFGALVLALSPGHVMQADAAYTIVTNRHAHNPPPALQADAAYTIVTSDSTKFTGNMTIDEDVLTRSGVTDLSLYDYQTLGETREERLKNILRI